MILLHWRLCGVYFIRTYCIGDVVVRYIFGNRCMGDSVAIGSCMSCVFKLLVGLSPSPMMRFEATESSSVMNS